MTDVEKIKEKIDIVDILRNSVQLKRSGRNFKALCPFHSEKTPSFYVSAERQVWHCFGCGKGGDVFTFLMEMEKLEFSEVLRILAKKAGVTLTQTYETTAEQKQKERLSQMHHLMTEYYHFLLTKHEIGKRAREYLENRGINEKVVKTFMLGYAPNSWATQVRFLIKRGYREKEIIKAGLGIRGKHGLYDRFRGRLIFPLRDYRGQTIGFSGRLLKKEVRGAKYINSPETPIYRKGNHFFGFDVTRDAIKKKGEVIVVEGEFDLLSSFQVGISNVVAIKGSSLTEGQIRLLKRFTDTVIFALDSDIAGDEAARRAIKACDQAGFSMRVVELPKGKDPDECIRQSRSLWKQSISDAKPIYDYFISSSTKRHKATTAEGKKKISQEVLPMLSAITNPIVQGHYIRILATTLDVAEETVALAVERISKKRDNKESMISSVDIGRRANRQERLEEAVLALVFKEEDFSLVLLITEIVDETDFSLPSFSKLFGQAKKLISEKKKLPLLDSFKKNVPDELVSVFDRLILLPVNELFPEKSENEFKRFLNHFKTNSLRRKIGIIATKIREVEERSLKDKEQRKELVKLNKGLSNLTEELKNIQAGKYTV